MPPQPLHRRVDHLIHEIARRHALRFDRAAAGRLGLSGAQLRVAAVLQEQPPAEGLTQCAIAGRLGLTEMAVAALCARMQSAGWVTREPSPADRRVRVVRLTPAARTELARAFDVADTLADGLLADLSATERADLLDLLQRVHARLVDAVPSPVPAAAAPASRSLRGDAVSAPADPGPRPARSRRAASPDAPSSRAATPVPVRRRRLLPPADLRR